MVRQNLSSLHLFVLIVRNQVNRSVRKIEVNKNTGNFRVEMDFKKSALILHLTIRGELNVTF